MVTGGSEKGRYKMDTGGKREECTRPGRLCSMHEGDGEAGWQEMKEREGQ